jgi:hypothetical protein
MSKWATAINGFLRLRTGGSVRKLSRPQQRNRYIVISLSSAGRAVRIALEVTMASMIVTESPVGQVGKRFNLKHRPLAGGRDPAQEIQLVDPEVSRRHFLIRMEGDDHVITELKAANGVFVNGAKVKEHKLQEGDQIRVGATVLVYSKQDDDDDAVQEQRNAERIMRERGTVLQDPVSPPRKRPAP